MVKIIFSGTYDGFSSWYDSDKNYNRRGNNDPVVRYLFDRGKYFYKGSGRLYRKGYCIQPICSEGVVGIFFHEIMLLSDFFGRGQGFMTVSLFLPKDKFLKGSVIRQALDELVSHYEMLADTGKAVIEIDWSFVDRKAEELNRIETDRVWNTLPPDKPSQGPALLRGLEPGDIDIYFTYPNPLFGILPNFEQVFLTEELLSDETTGYSVILKKNADPTNPDISVPRPSDYNYNVLEWKAERMKKKTLEAELKANGDQLCWGKVSKPGYKTGEVWLTNEDLKKLDDRYEIRLSPPTLNMMEATVTLHLMDKEQNQPIGEEKIDNFTFEWSCLSVTAKPEKQGVRSFRFKGEQCENKAWTVKVSHSSYRQTVETIMVSDDITPINHSIVMEPKKVIVISVNAPDSYKHMVQKEYVVYEDVKDRTIEYIGEKFKKFEDELQVDVLDKGNGMVQVEVKERPKPTIWKILAVTEESVNSNVAETEYNGDDPIKLSEEVIRFKEKLEKELLWKVKLKENGEEDVINDIKKKQVILKVVRIPKPPIVAPPLDLTSETVQSETVTTPIHPSNGTTTAPAASTTIPMSDDKPEEEKPKEKSRIFYILLDYDSKNFPLFKNKNKNNVVEDDGAGGDSVKYDWRLHCLTWVGLSNDRPDPSKLRLKGDENYRYEFDNSSELQWSDTLNGTRFKVNKCSKEEPKTFYIPLDVDSKKFDLFVKYKTPEEAKDAIVGLQNQRFENKNDLQLAKDIVDCLNKGKTENASQLTKYFSKDKTGKRLCKIAKIAIDMKKHSYVVEGDDSVRYDKKNHCLTWEGLSGQCPKPTSLRLKEFERQRYEFEAPDALRWAEKPGDPKYTLKIDDQKNLNLWGRIKQHKWIAFFASFAVVIMIVFAVVAKLIPDEFSPSDKHSIIKVIKYVIQKIKEKPETENVIDFNDAQKQTAASLVDNYGGERNVRYSGDVVWDSIQICYKACNESIKKNASLAGDGLYMKLQTLYNNQAHYKQCDSLYWHNCYSLLQKLEKWDDCDSMLWFTLQGNHTWLEKNGNIEGCAFFDGKSPSSEWKEHAMLSTVQNIEDRFNQLPKPQKQGEERPKTVLIPDNSNSYKELVIEALKMDSIKWKSNVPNSPRIKDYANYLAGFYNTFLLSKFPLGRETERDVFVKGLIQNEKCHIKEALDQMNNQFANANDNDKKTYYGINSKYVYFVNLLNPNDQYNRYVVAQPSTDKRGDISKKTEIKKVHPSNDTINVGDGIITSTRISISPQDLFVNLADYDFATQGWDSFNMKYELSGNSPKETNDANAFAQEIFDKLSPNNPNRKNKDDYATTYKEAGNGNGAINKLKNLKNNL